MAVSLPEAFYKNVAISASIMLLLVAYLLGALGLLKLALLARVCFYVRTRRGTYDMSVDLHWASYRSRYQDQLHTSSKKQGSHISRKRE